MAPVIMAAVLGLASFSCSESPLPALQPEDPESVFSGIITEDFWVGPEGKIVYALEGIVTLEFPEETLTEQTLFTVSLFPLNQVYMSEYNMMNCGIHLEAAARELKFKKSVQLELNYCTSDFKSGTPVNEENITIYNLIPNVDAFSIGECSVDCTWKMICGCIDKCGFYVIGEN